MKRQENRLALSVLATLTAAIALIYTLIVYHDIIFVVAGMSLLFLSAAYILTQNLIAFSSMKSKSMNVQIKESINDIASQLEVMSSSQAQISKATFLYTKQIAQNLALLENNYTENQETLYKNLTHITNTQNKATKLMIRYDQNNTTKLISTIKELRNQLSDTMIQGFDQLQPNNDDMIAVLENLIDYLKIQSTVSNHSSTVEEKAFTPTFTVVGKSTEETVYEDGGDSGNPDNSEEITPVEDIMPAENITPVEDIMPAENIMPTEDITPVQDITSEQDVVSGEDHISSTPKTIGDLSEDSNRQLSADEIAALFAAAEPNPEQTISEEESHMNEAIEHAEPINETPISEDSNKTLSPDEIAALFASLG